MKIKSKLNADIVAFNIKRNSAHDGREAYVDLEVSVRHEEAAKKFGEEFAALAFSTMRTIVAGEDDEGDKIGFLVDDIKPGKNLVYERHIVAIGEDKDEITAQPELLKISPVDGEQRVIAKIRLPVDVTKAGLISKLTKSVGQTVKVEFNPSQGELKFPKGNGAAKVADVEAPAEAH